MVCVDAAIVAMRMEADGRGQRKTTRPSRKERNARKGGPSWSTRYRFGKQHRLQSSRRAAVVCVDAAIVAMRMEADGRGQGSVEAGGRGRRSRYPGKTCGQDSTEKSQCVRRRAAVVRAVTYFQSWGSR